MTEHAEPAGRKKRLVELPLPGKAARAFREGAQTCPNRRYGKIRWEDFLQERFRRIDETGGERI
jgi:hypothetical protein